VLYCVLVLVICAVEFTVFLYCLYSGPYLRTGQRGPGPGLHIKKIEIEVWYAGEKKRLSTREKFKGDLY
jgi:hypothetical protein